MIAPKIKPRIVYSMPASFATESGFTRLITIC
jgi:hypothetical protein